VKKNNQRLLAIGALAITIIIVTIGIGLTPSLAYPQVTTISNVSSTIITDQSFTVSWITENNSTGEVHYGNTPDNLNKIAYDTRGNSIADDTHYVTLSGLTPATTYYYDVHSNGVIDNNNGSHFITTTGPTLALPGSDTAYGKVYLPNGTTPAVGCIIYITLEDNDGLNDPGQASPLSSLVDSAGWWYWNLTDSRIQDLSKYFSYSASGDKIQLEAMCPNDGTANLIIDTGNDSPAPDIILQENLIPTPTATVIPPQENYFYLPFTIKY